MSALLSRVLLSFALEYEREAGLSLAISANVLRVLGRGGTRLRDLPPLTGTSKEAVSWALGILIRETGRRRNLIRPRAAARSPASRHQPDRTVE